MKMTVGIRADFDEGDTELKSRFHMVASKVEGSHEPNRAER
jgi:hypothetical protein